MDRDLSSIDKAFVEYGGPKNYANRGDIKAASIFLLGKKLRKKEVVGLIEHEQKFRRGAPPLPEPGLLLEEFRRVMTDRIKWQDPEQEIKDTFEAFDRTGNGFLTQSDLQHACHRVSGRLDEGTVRQVFAEVDTDLNGKVGFREFRAAMIYNTNHPRPYPRPAPITR